MDLHTHSNPGTCTHTLYDLIQSNNHRGTKGGSTQSQPESPSSIWIHFPKFEQTGQMRLKTLPFGILLTLYLLWVLFSFSFPHFLFTLWRLLQHLFWKLLVKGYFVHKYIKGLDWLVILLMITKRNVKLSSSFFPPHLTIITFIYLLIIICIKNLICKKQNKDKDIPKQKCEKDSKVCCFYACHMCWAWCHILCDTSYL